MRRFSILALALGLLINFSGCWCLKPQIPQRYTLKERRTAVNQHLSEKYGEEFIEIALEPKGILADFDTFFMYPKAGTEKDKFVVYCVQTATGLSISDGYFGILIHDEYDKLMNDMIGTICDEYFLNVSTQLYKTWSDRYNRETKISELYQKGEKGGYWSDIFIYIKESSLSDRSPNQVLQTIAQKMLDQSLNSTVTICIVKNDQYNNFKIKSAEETSDITSDHWREYFVYPLDKTSPDYRVAILEDKDSAELHIKHYNHY